MDDNVAVNRTSGDWCRISAPTTGWIPCNNVSGLTTAQRTNSVAPAAAQGYDWSTDPNFGPAAQGGLHTSITVVQLSPIPGAALNRGTPTPSLRPSFVRSLDQ